MIHKVDDIRLNLSNKQTTFIKGRQIFNGIIIANEMIDESKREKKKEYYFETNFVKRFKFVSGLKFSTRYNIVLEFL
jgi:hypothetical protein